MSSGLTVTNIAKSFGGAKVLHDISFSVGSDELLVLLGSSGCGKSTLLRILAGLEIADAGEIHLDGKKIDRLQPRERNVALVFQNYSLYPHMTVEENIGFPLRVAGLSKKDRVPKVAEVARLLGLEHRLKARPAELSGGQRQRVALGRAIVRQPSLFLLDEPLSNLDAELRLRMRAEIVRIQRTLKRPAIHVTHDQSEAMGMADRIALMKDGEILQLGTPKELFEQPRTLYVATFLGSPRINILEGRVENGLLQPLGIPLPAHDTRRSHARILLGIRPHQIEIHPNGNYEGMVTSNEYVGEGYHVTFRAFDTTMIASLADGDFSTESVIRFNLAPERILFFDPASGARIG